MTYCSKLYTGTSGFKQRCHRNSNHSGKCSIVPDPPSASQEEDSDAVLVVALHHIGYQLQRIADALERK